MTWDEEVKAQASWRARLIVETLYDEKPERFTRDMHELVLAIEKAILDVALPLLERT